MRKNKKDNICDVHDKTLRLGVCFIVTALLIIAAVLFTRHVTIERLKVLSVVGCTSESCDFVAMHNRDWVYLTGPTDLQVGDDVTRECFTTLTDDNKQCFNVKRMNTLEIKEDEFNPRAES